VQLLSRELFLSGREREAYDLVDRWFAAPSRPRDPWRLFGYGDFRRLPELVAELRREVAR
jgi:hypothetical protein